MVILRSLTLFVPILCFGYLLLTSLGKGYVYKPRPRPTSILPHVPTPSPTEYCPAGYYFEPGTGQCLPEIERLLPLRSLTVSTSTTPSYVLLDKQRHTHLATSPTKSTTLLANLGKDYLVMTIRLSYRNLSTQNVRVLVYDAKGKQVGAGYFKPRKSGTLVLSLKKQSNGRVPTGKLFEIVIPKSRVRVSEVSFSGGSTVSEVASGKAISWGLAVVVDFANSTLEDYGSDQDPTAINNVQDIRQQLDLMESQWLRMSRGAHQIEWVIERVTLDQDLAPNEFENSWEIFRETVATKILNKVRLEDYDSNADGILDHAWLVLAAKNIKPEGEFFYLVPGRSMHNNVDIFADIQGDQAPQESCTGCFNHEVAHTDVFKLSDLYGDFSNLGGLSLMSYPWGNKTEQDRMGFLAFDFMKVGWSQPLFFSATTVSGGVGVILNSMEDSDGQAALLETGVPNEYFMIEYRKRVAYWLDTDGTIITHINENQGDNQKDPPRIRVEPADGVMSYGEWPTATSFWYPENEAMPEAFIGKLYGEEKGIFRVTDFRRHGENAMSVSIYFGEF
jgi:M6 family metalloprotease-like protein